MTYKLDKVTIRLKNDVEGIDKIREIFTDIVSGEIPLLFNSDKELIESIAPVSEYSNYESDETGEYDLSVIKDFPIMLIGGDMDKLGTPEDVTWLRDELSKNNNIVYFKILPNMGHLSFMVANDYSWFDEAFQIIMNLRKEKK